MIIPTIIQGIFFGSSDCGCPTPPPTTTPPPPPPQQLCITLPCLPPLQLPQIPLPQLCPCAPAAPSCGC
ncbi:Hypothetical protein SRAE_1000237600 [Strongyloides ratti]|uniref:Uncharacterized protein n=1 Tax=Strongyloides ratti TaxID=34506 RepID=A0A090L2T4_STRRB|nr:Hypothetical protein SRAE_1000237600 [Strongyloides ratti]CEF64121.1 Hypothetical protein SRAE_1000237600 [Strongyloides ratti]